MKRAIKTNGSEENRIAVKSVAELPVLGDVPIVNPWAEKALADRGYTYLGDLSRPEPLRARVIEIYRRCYEDPGQGRPLSPEEVVSDFVEAYPDLIFQADWLRALVETQVANRDFRKESPRTKLFGALANGFRRAAGADARVNRSIRAARLEAARFALRDLKDELAKWDQDLDRQHSTGDWLDDETERKVNSIVLTDERLAPLREELCLLLRESHLYEASILITATLYGVRQRDLEAKPSLP